MRRPFCIDGRKALGSPPVVAGWEMSRAPWRGTWWIEHQPRGPGGSSRRASPRQQHERPHPLQSLRRALHETLKTLKAMEITSKMWKGEFKDFKRSKIGSYRVTWGAFKRIASLPKTASAIPFFTVTVETSWAKTGRKQQQGTMSCTLLTSGTSNFELTWERRR